MAEQAGDEERPSAHLSTQHGVPETPTRTGLTFPLPHHLFISMGPPAEPQSFSLPSFFPLFSSFSMAGAESLWDDGFQWNVIYHLIQAVMVGRPAPWRDMANFIGHGEKGLMNGLQMRSPSNCQKFLIFHSSLHQSELAHFNLCTPSLEREKDWY